MGQGKICVSVCGRSVEETLAKIERAEEFADVIEIRFDCLSDEEFDVRDKEKTLTTIRQIFARNREAQYLTTFRPKDQGGYREITRQERLNFWDSGSSDGWADLEEDVIGSVRAESRETRICSHHDFSGVPENLDDIYDRLKNTGADVVKIAVQIDEASYAIPIWKLLNKSAPSGDAFIPIAMGEAGKWTRILGLAHGAFMTYASLETGSETAPGQISAEDMIDVFRVKELDRDTDVYGIIAGDTSYTASPFLHNAAFKVRKLNSVFVPLQVADLAGFMRRMVKPRTREIDLNFKGFSVTNPHKQSIIEYLDHVDDAAKTIGAVNTVKFEGGKLSGFNTDAPGFITPLRARFGDLAGARVAIAGAGGAARACVYALKQERADVEILARDGAKAEALAAEFGTRSNDLATNNERSNTDFSNFDIIVNATPLGTKGSRQNETIATADKLKDVKLVYDLIYNPAETRLMHEARSAGVDTLGGLEMMISQGTKQFEIWTGLDAPVEEMTAAVKKRLNL
jgi:3-dehydroquinate dehydratase / shikimate dehydrogenase